MTIRTASCPCGQLQARCTGEPVRVSVCHCLDCQRRSGSAFAAQARWPDAQVTLTGERREWRKVGDSGRAATFSFCPQCGATVAYVIDALPGLTGVPLGAFADPGFPPPGFSMFENRKHPSVAIIGDLEHD